MPDRRLALPEDAGAIEELARTLSQSVNARVLAVLMERRRRDAGAGRQGGRGADAGASAGPGPDRSDTEGGEDDLQRPEGPGWMYLSEIAEAMGEAPGTVGSSLQKLLRLLEEQRVKGRRYFRSRVVRLEIVVEEVE